MMDTTVEKQSSSWENAWTNLELAQKLLVRSLLVGSSTWERKRCSATLGKLITERQKPVSALRK